MHKLNIDINTLRSIATLILFLAFIGMCFWVFNAKRRAGFEEAAQLPFADEKKETRPENQHSRQNQRKV